MDSDLESMLNDSVLLIQGMFIFGALVEGERKNGNPFIFSNAKAWLVDHFVDDLDSLGGSLGCYLSCHSPVYVRGEVHNHPQ
jgi:hypothetical protein